MSISYDVGVKMGEWLAQNPHEARSYDPDKTECAEIPGEDAAEIRRRGEEPNTRQYWDGVAAGYDA